MKTISVLGSTGSIGTQTLDVVRHHSDLRIAALAAGKNITLLEKQIREFSPCLAAVADEEKALDLKARVKDLDVRVVSGMEGLIEAACISQADITVTAIVGMIGIRPTIAAIRAGKDIALANACDGRPSDHAARKGIRREDSSGGFRALRNLSVPERRAV